MHNLLCRLIALMGCFLLLGLAGCAKPRTGPFDVPSAIPSSGTATGTKDMSQVVAQINAAKVLFAFDRADIRSDAREALGQVAALLRQYSSIRISIRGHCDERGSREYNFDLGERRARAAYGYLLSVGVPPCQMEMVTYGKKTPAVYGRSESVWAMNRRVEFSVLTTCY